MEIDLVASVWLPYHDETGGRIELGKDEAINLMLDLREFITDKQDHELIINLSRVDPDEQ